MKMHHADDGTRNRRQKGQEKRGVVEAMTDKVFDNNQVSVAGEIVSTFTFSHEVFGEGFYSLYIQVGRLSESYDVIPLMVSERLLDVKQDYRGKYIEVLGQFRSYNRHESSRNRLVLSVFAREVHVCDGGESEMKPNHIYLDGFICKSPVYRKTPLGREIADLLVAVNRPYGKSDYIPGAHIQLWGRIQSREYQKKLSETEVEKRVAYEVSVSKLECLEVEEKTRETMENA